MDIVPLSELEQCTPCLFDAQSSQLPERADPAAKPRGLWIDPVQFLTLINGLELAHWACTIALLWTQRLHPALPPPRHPGGAPRVYSDETVLLTVLALRACPDTSRCKQCIGAWHISLEKIADWLPRYRALAVALGMSPDGPTISAAQLSRRSRQLGLWPYFFFFIALVWQLLRVGAVSGSHLILDSSLLKAWYGQDPDATLAGRRRGPPTYGYKIHAVVDRWSYLPLLFVITPANVHEMAVAALLLLATVLLYGLRVSIVYADSAYFSTPFIWLIRRLGAIPIIDYNLRRQGKRFLATLFFLDQWRRMRGPRTVIERCFAFLKRYYGLKHFQVEGLPAVWRQALLVHAVMLAVALIAYPAGRPDLMTSRAQVLAFVTN